MDNGRMKKAQDYWRTPRGKEVHGRANKKYYKSEKGQESRRKTDAKRKIYKRELYHKLRKTVLMHYGGNPPICSCCRESRIEFLAINHINGGGTAHRGKIGKGSLYPWLRKNNYPSGYNVLCHNCNMSIGFYGYCPHKKDAGNG